MPYLWVVLPDECRQATATETQQAYGNGLLIFRNCQRCQHDSMMSAGQVCPIDHCSWIGCLSLPSALQFGFGLDQILAFQKYQAAPYYLTFALTACDVLHNELSAERNNHVHTGWPTTHQSECGLTCIRTRL